MKNYLIFAFCIVCLTPLTGSAKPIKLISDQIVTRNANYTLRQVSDTTLYTAPKITPKFPGGDAAYKEFIRKNLKYPSSAIDRNIWGMVYLVCVVEKDGQLTNLRVLRSPDDDLTKEAIRLFNILPKWVPGQQKGEVVRVQIVLPVLFDLYGK